MYNVIKFKTKMLLIISNLNILLFEYDYIIMIIFPSKVKSEIIYYN